MSKNENVVKLIDQLLKKVNLEELTAGILEKRKAEICIRIRSSNLVKSIR